MPPSFVRLPAARGSLWVLEGLRESVLTAGLDEPANWPRGAEPRSAAAGRGPVKRLPLVGGPPVILKQMRRGGRLAPLWGERFLGRARLRANLEIPAVARERGVATPRVIALLEMPGPPGLYRGWLAVEEIVGARNLLDLLRDDPRDDDVAAAVEAIRAMHDAGIEHRDLNLGNVLVVRGSPASRGFVVDLDRARAHRPPLGSRRRRAGLRRLERSYRKAFGAIGPLGERPGDRLIDLYAAGDASLRKGLGRGRALARLALAIRAAGWKRGNAP